MSAEFGQGWNGVHPHRKHGRIGNRASPPIPQSGLATSRLPRIGEAVPMLRGLFGSPNRDEHQGER